MTSLLKKSNTREQCEKQIGNSKNPKIVPKLHNDWLYVLAYSKASYYLPISKKMSKTTFIELTDGNETKKEKEKLRFSLVPSNHKNFSSSYRLPARALKSKL
ncbi:hypothetical protein AVEN_6032-1 [Araneus ventricosus]|uniref:Uncharacterized protein n=1 Tax=Araneus ventricosus TaxID=182803 RepID=A0A4Y2SPI9_ARAVE|nr:hypothetical protein AVEN_6032-1 [Araneus ventricosus]